MKIDLKGHLNVLNIAVSKLNRKLKSFDSRYFAQMKKYPLKFHKEMLAIKQQGNNKFASKQEQIINREFIFR